MNSDMVWQIVRYLLLMASPVLASSGIATTTQWQTVVGVIVAGLTFLWGMYVKWNTKTVAASATAVTAPGTTTVHPATGSTVVNSYSFLVVLLLLPMLLAVMGCQATQAVSNLEGSAVSPTAVLVSASSFDGVESVGTGYLQSCALTVKPYPTWCSHAAINAVDKALKSGRLARNALEAFQAKYPGQIGATGLYTALSTAITTLNKIYAQYSIS